MDGFQNKNRFEKAQKKLQSGCKHKDLKLTSQWHLSYVTLDTLINVRVKLTEFSTHILGWAKFGVLYTALSGGGGGGTEGTMGGWGAFLNAPR